MPGRRIRLRYRGTCAGCGSALEIKASAWWDDETKTILCESCEASVQPCAENSRIGAAGGSAQREFERRKARHEANVRSRHPRIGGLILALAEEPPVTRSWAKGAEGERLVGADLDGLAPAGVIAIHDRRRPGTTANIDHLAVTPSGVWVIDAKRYKGQVRKKDVGGWFSTDIRLYVGRRDRTKLATAMAKQVGTVRAAVGAEWAHVPVRPMLCFVGTEWSSFAKPFELDGVLVTWPPAMRELLVRPGPCEPATVELIAAQLRDSLEPAS